MLLCFAFTVHISNIYKSCVIITTDNVISACLQVKFLTSELLVLHFYQRPESSAPKSVDYNWYIYKWSVPRYLSSYWHINLAVKLNLKYKVFSWRQTRFMWVKHCHLSGKYEINITKDIDVLHVATSFFLSTHAACKQCETFSGLFLFVIP